MHFNNVLFLKKVDAKITWDHIIYILLCRALPSPKGQNVNQFLQGQNNMDSFDCHWWHF